MVGKRSSLSLVFHVERRASDPKYRPLALLPKIFDLCVNDTLPSGSALNLDLTLVKRLVDIHDGSVRAWSGGGRTTTRDRRCTNRSDRPLD